MAALGSSPVGAWLSRTGMWSNLPRAGPGGGVPGLNDCVPLPSPRTVGTSEGTNDVRRAAIEGSGVATKANEALPESGAACNLRAFATLDQGHRPLCTLVAAILRDMATANRRSPLEELKEDLRKLDPRAFAMYRIFDTVPVLFSQQDEWTEWKLRLAKELSVDPYSIVVIGSGCVGFSLHPEKNFRRFGPDSDVDVAVVSSYHFEVAWRFLRDVGAQLYSYPRDVQASIKNHRAEYLFWGTIATEKLLPLLMPFGPIWVKALAAIEQSPPVNGKALKLRLYRDSYSLVGYHVNGIGKLRQILMAPKT